MNADFPKANMVDTHASRKNILDNSVKLGKSDIFMAIFSTLASAGLIASSIDGAMHFSGEPWACITWPAFMLSVTVSFVYPLWRKKAISFSFLLISFVAISSSVFAVRYINSHGSDFGWRLAGYDEVIARIQADSIPANSVIRENGTEDASPNHSGYRAVLPAGYLYLSADGEFEVVKHFGQEMVFFYRDGFLLHVEWYVYTFDGQPPKYGCHSSRPVNPPTENWFLCIVD